MKKILLLFSLFVVATTGLYAQVGINTVDPNKFSALDITDEHRGLLIPRVGLVSLTLFENPITNGAKEGVESLLVYNTTDDATEKLFKGYYYWHDKKWRRVISGEDFTNDDILKGSGVVVYRDNKLKYYGDTKIEETPIISAINSSTETTKISINKIAGESKKGDLVLSSDNKGAVSWKTITDVVSSTVKTSDLTLKDGLAFDGISEKTAKVLSGSQPYTLTLKDVPLSVLKATSTPTATKILGVKTDTSSVTFLESGDIAGAITKGAISGDGNIDVAGSPTNSVFGSGVSLSLTKVPLDKIELPTGGVSEDKDKVLILGEENSKVKAKWDKISGSNISGGTLTTEGGIQINDIISNTGTYTKTGVVLGDVTLKLGNIPITSIDPSAGEKGKFLTVEGIGQDKKVIWGEPEVNVKNLTASPNQVDKNSMIVVDKTGSVTLQPIESLVSNTTKIMTSNGISKTTSVDGTENIKLGGEISENTELEVKDNATLKLKGLKPIDDTKIDNSKIVLLDDTGVMRTVTTTTLKGNGDYKVVNSGSTNITDNKTGNTFTPASGGTPLEEKIRTVLVKTNGSTKLTDKALNVGSPDNTLITEVRVMGASATNRSVLSSSYNYSVSGDNGVIGLGLPGTTISVGFPTGNYYVTIKYVSGVTSVAP